MSFYKARYETHDEIPSRVADLFVERDGAWHFAVPEALSDPERVPLELIDSIEREVAAIVSPIRERLAEAERQRAEQDAEIAGYQSREREHEVAATIRKSARSTGLLDSAHEDAIAFAVADGVEPEGVREFLLTARQQRPHWFSLSPSSGARRRLF